MSTVKEPVVQVLLDRDWAAGSLVDDVRRGLGAHPRSLPPKWLYDDRGSELFDAITRLPERTRDPARPCARDRPPVRGDHADRAR